MRITDIKATTVTVPLEAPLLHSNGAHWGRFVRTIIEVETDEGIVGLGEMGGGGASAEDAFRGLKAYLVGHDPFQFEELRFKICNLGGKMQYVNGAIGVPDGPGLGVALNREKLAEYAELYRALGGYSYDRDPSRPNWFPLIPNDRWAKTPRVDGETTHDISPLPSSVS